MLIIPSLDRLSRDVRIAENLFHEFEKLGVRVLIADMPTYNSKDRRDVLIRQIREAIAEENRKDIVERLWKGRQERVRRGLAAGGNVPYGHRRHEKQLVPDRLEAAVVRKIFEAAGQAESCSDIARALNAEGVMRRNGKPWAIRQIAGILSREMVYLYRDGTLRYGEAAGQNTSLALLRVNRLSCNRRSTGS